ncbi:hypothetical protein ACFL1K_02175 [Candidatus Omnitrophota bacterium]
MKKSLMILCLIFFVLGCGKKPARGPQDRILAKINNYEISLGQFEDEFRQSSYSMANTLAARKEFLDILIIRKLILQDAQSKGLDKDPDFLKMIERFWEHSLLKLTLDQKSDQISGKKLGRKKEAKLLQEWEENLRKKACIIVDEGLIKEKE